MNRTAEFQYGRDVPALAGEPSTRQSESMPCGDRAPLRVLMVTDFYHPYVGGVEQHVRSLCSELTKRGHDVAVVTLWRSGLPELEVDNGTRVYRVRASAQRFSRLFKNADRPWAPPTPDPELLRAIQQIVQSEKPDVVHGHDWLVRSFLPLKRWSGATLVVSLHYYTLSCARKSLMRHGRPCNGPGILKCGRCATAHYGRLKGIATGLGNWVASAIERKLVDMFIAVSDATATGNQLYDSNVPYRVIPNFLPDDAEVLSGDSRPYVASLPEDGFVLFVGDLRREKGLDVLLEAYAGICDAPPLVLIGKIWPDTPKTFPQNTVVLRDWPNFAVMEAWRRSGIAVVPSIWPEPFGIVVIEAMAGSSPVIGSRIGGITDIVVDGETGYLVEPGDPAELRIAIERLVADPRLREQMGRAGAQRAGSYRASVIVPQIEDAYYALVSQNNEVLVQ